MSDERGGNGGLSRAQRIAALVTQQQLRTLLRAARKHSEIDAEMVEILAEIARSGEHERHRMRSAETLRAQALAGARFALDVAKAGGEQQSEGPSVINMNVYPPKPSPDLTDEEWKLICEKRAQEGEPSS